MLWFAGGLIVAVVVLGIPPNSAHGQTKLVMVFNPILETDVVLFSGQQIGRMLGTSLGIPVEAVVATSYAATILAMCAGRADVAFLNPFAYVLARQLPLTEVRGLQETRHEMRTKGRLSRGGGISVSHVRAGLTLGGLTLRPARCRLRVADGTPGHVRGPVEVRVQPISAA